MIGLYLLLDERINKFRWANLRVSTSGGVCLEYLGAPKETVLLDEFSLPVCDFSSGLYHYLLKVPGNRFVFCYFYDPSNDYLYEPLRFEQNQWKIVPEFRDKPKIDEELIKQFKQSVIVFRDAASKDPMLKSCRESYERIKRTYPFSWDAKKKFYFDQMENRSNATATALPFSWGGDDDKYQDAVLSLSGDYFDMYPPDNIISNLPTFWHSVSRWWHEEDVTNHASQRIDNFFCHLPITDNNQWIFFAFLKKPSPDESVAEKRSALFLKKLKEFCVSPFTPFLQQITALIKDNNFVDILNIVHNKVLPKLISLGRHLLKDIYPEFSPEPIVKVWHFVIKQALPWDAWLAYHDIKIDVPYQNLLERNDVLSNRIVSLIASGLFLFDLRNSNDFFARIEKRLFLLQCFEIKKIFTENFNPANKAYEKELRNIFNCIKTDILNLVKESKNQRYHEGIVDITKREGDDYHFLSSGLSKNALNAIERLLPELCVRDSGDLHTYYSGTISASPATLFNVPPPHIDTRQNINRVHDANNLNKRL